MPRVTPSDPNVMESNKDRVKIVLVGLWLAFTVAQASWWLIFGLRQLDRLDQLGARYPSEIQQYYRMLLWEGGVLIALLIGGGIALFSYALRERRRHQQVEEFFAAFTHDSKTALASLRLQAESLREDLESGLPQTVPNPLLERLLKDTLRLQLQLENSLFLVNLRTGRLLTETLRVGRLVESLRHHWPEISLELNGDGVVRADARALESVLTNLIQNAVTHGQAKRINITASDVGEGQLQLLVADNGQGFQGDFGQLGTLFVRHTRSSGSGAGLYISRQLVKRMGGELKFAPGAEGGFVAILSLPQTSADNVATQLNRVPA